MKSPLRVVYCTIMTLNGDRVLGIVVLGIVIDALSRALQTWIHPGNTHAITASHQRQDSAGNWPNGGIMISVFVKLSDAA